MTDRNNEGPRGTQAPRQEPEIIPPDRAGDRSRGIWISVNENGETRRVYMARPGPLTIILALAVLALIALVMLILLLSVALIWIPVVIVLVLAFVLSVYWQRFRRWVARR
jgi:hypothetical protein